MELTETEISELKTICEYLDNLNPEIVKLGISLYKLDYEDKLKEYIKNIQLGNVKFYGRFVYICEYYTDKFKCYPCLENAIRHILMYRSDEIY